MTGWNAERTPGRPKSGKGVMAVTLLALLLVAALPLALLAGVILLLLGHVAAGLAVLAAAVLTPTVAIAIAGISGLRRLRKLISANSLPVVTLDRSQYSDVEEPEASDHPNVVRLDRSEYTEVP